MKGNGLLFLLLGIGGLVWYESKQSSTATPSPTSTTTGTQPVSTTPLATTVPAASPVPAAAPSYSGPSLNQIYQSLVAAVLQGMQDGDTDVVCAPSGVSGLGVRVMPVATQQTVIAARPRPIAAGVAPTVPRIMPTQTQATTPTACTSPLATPDVWDWYLVNKTNSGITITPGSNVAFAGSDLTQKISGQQYWSVMAPLLQQQVPGLSGFRGMAPMMALHRMEKVPMSYPYGGWGR